MRRSLVTPGCDWTTAARRPMIRLIRVDFPTLGRPTTATTAKRSEDIPQRLRVRRRRENGKDGLTKPPSHLESVPPVSHAAGKTNTGGGPDHHGHHQSLLPRDERASQPPAGTSNKPATGLSVSDRPCAHPENTTRHGGGSGGESQGIDRTRGRRAKGSPPPRGDRLTARRNCSRQRGRCPVAGV